MQKIKSLLKGKKKLVYAVGAVLLIIVVLLVLRKNNNTEQTITIKTSDFTDQVSISGKVIPTESVDLGFKNSGRIEHVYYDVDQSTEKRQIVRAGSLIAMINATEALKNVHDAETSLASAKLSLEKSQLQNSTENLNANLQKAYDDGFIAVSDAFLDIPNTLDGLESLLNLENLSDNSARISGTTATNYRNDAEALYYKAKDAFEKNRINFRTLDRNSTKTDVEKIINETYDTTKILMDAIKSMKNFVDYLADDTSRPADYASSSSTLYSYSNTINSHLSSLLSIKTSIKNYKDAFSTTGFDKDSLALSVKQKENDLVDAQNKLADYYITAPFDGIITKIDAKVGEIASANIPLVTMMSVGTFQIESYVPEVNISKIKLNNTAQVTLDAYGEGATFGAKVISIDPAETIKDGVSTYKVRFQFENEDVRIKSGMTANVSVFVFNKPNTIVIPGGVIFERDGKKFVQVKENGVNVDREIVTGMTSSLDQVEVISGLVDGDIVLLNPINTSVK